MYPISVSDIEVFKDDLGRVIGSSESIHVCVRPREWVHAACRTRFVGVGGTPVHRSDWTIPIMSEEKKEGTYRICADYQLHIVIDIVINKKSLYLNLHNNILITCDYDNCQNL